MRREKRDSEVQARILAMQAARLIISDKISSADAAARTGSNRYAISQATMILRFGSEDEIAGLDKGELTLKGVYDDILARTTREQRLMKRYGPVVRDEVVQKRNVEAEVWQNLREALSRIGSLPSTTDTAAIVRKNPQRMEYVSRTLLASLEWIQGFSDEITR